MTEKEIKQQVIEKLENLLELARRGENLRLVAALKSDDTVGTVVVCTEEEAATLLLGWTQGNRGMLYAMETAAGAARQMIAEGRFDSRARHEKAQGYAGRGLKKKGLLNSRLQL